MADLFPLGTAKTITPKKKGQDEPAPQGALLNTGGEWVGGRGPPRTHRSCERCLAGGTRLLLSRACANSTFIRKISDLGWIDQQRRTRTVAGSSQPNDISGALSS